LLQSVEIAKKINYQQGLTESYNDLAILNISKHAYPLALNYLKSSLSVKQPPLDNSISAEAFGLMGDIYLKHGQYDVSVACYLKGLKILEKIKDEKGASEFSAAIGKVHTVTENYRPALKFYEKSNLIKARIKDDAGSVRNLIKMALIYEKLNQYTDAFECNFNGLKIVDSKSNPLDEVELYRNIGKLYFLKENYATALRYWEISAEKDKILDNKLGLIKDYIYISKANSYQQNLPAAEQYLGLAEQLNATQQSFQMKGWAEEARSAILERKSKHKEALTAFKLFVEIGDSISNQEQNNIISLKEAKFEFEKKVLTDSLKNEDVLRNKEMQIQIQKDEINTRLLRLYLLIFGILLIAILIWLFVSRYKAVIAHRNAERKLQFIEKEKLLVEERGRIADEMHDDVGADLSSLLMRIRVTEKQSEPTADNNISNIKHAAGSVIHNIDQIIWSLNSDRTFLTDIISFISSYFESVLRDEKLLGAMYVPDAVPKITVTAKQKRDILLAVKTAVCIVLKYSNISRLELNMTYQFQQLIIGIKDDGLQWNAADQSFQLELKKIKRFVEKHDGKYRLHYIKHEGNLIELIFSIDTKVELHL